MYVCEQDSEDEIEVRRRSSHRPIKILDDNESEHRSIYTRVMEIEDSEDENGTSFETPHKLAEDVIAEFEAWFRSANGGKLDEKTSQQHGKQFSKLLKVVVDKCNFTSLFDDYLINQKFLEG